MFIFAQPDSESVVGTQFECLCFRTSLSLTADSAKEFGDIMNTDTDIFNNENNWSVQEILFIEVIQCKRVVQVIWFIQEIMWWK